MCATRHKSSEPPPNRHWLVVLAMITAVLVTCTAVIQFTLALLALLHRLGGAQQHLQPPAIDDIPSASWTCHWPAGMSSWTTTPPDPPH